MKKALLKNSLLAFVLGVTGLSSSANAKDSMIKSPVVVQGEEGSPFEIQTNRDGLKGVEASKRVEEQTSVEVQTNKDVQKTEVNALTVSETPKNVEIQTVAPKTEEIPTIVEILKTEEVSKEGEVPTVTEAFKTADVQTTVEAPKASEDQTNVDDLATIEAETSTETQTVVSKTEEVPTIVEISKTEEVSKTEEAPTIGEVSKTEEAPKAVNDPSIVQVSKEIEAPKVTEIQNDVKKDEILSTFEKEYEKFKISCRTFTMANRMLNENLLSNKRLSIILLSYNYYIEKLSLIMAIYRSREVAKMGITQMEMDAKSLVKSTEGALDTTIQRFQKVCQLAQEGYGIMGKVCKKSGLVATIDKDFICKIESIQNFLKKNASATVLDKVMEPLENLVKSTRAVYLANPDETISQKRSAIRSDLKQEG